MKSLNTYRVWIKGIYTRVDVIAVALSEGEAISKVLKERSIGLSSIHSVSQMNKGGL